MRTKVVISAMKICKKKHMDKIASFNIKSLPKYNLIEFVASQNPSFFPCREHTQSTQLYIYMHIHMYMHINIYKETLTQSQSLERFISMRR